MDIEPLVDRLEVLADGRTRDAEVFRDLRIGQPGRDRREHLTLPGRQPQSAQVVFGEQQYDEVTDPSRPDRQTPRDAGCDSRSREGRLGHRAVRDTEVALE